MMNVVSIKTTHSIARRILSTDNSKIIVCENNPKLALSGHTPEIPLEDTTILSALWLTELICFTQIESLAESELLVLPDDATESERQSLALKALWADDNRFDLDVWIREGFDSPWIKTGSSPLRNSEGYQYLRHKVLDLLTDAPALEIGTNGAVAISIEDAGAGYPAPGDNITIYGSYLYHHQLITQGVLPEQGNLSPNDILFSQYL